MVFCHYTSQSCHEQFLLPTTAAEFESIGFWFCWSKSSSREIFGAAGVGIRVGKSAESQQCYSGKMMITYGLGIIAEIGYTRNHGVGRCVLSTDSTALT